MTSGEQFTNVPGGTAHWTFAGGTATTTTSQAASRSSSRKADATVSVTGYTGVYDGDAPRRDGHGDGREAVKRLTGLLTLGEQLHQRARRHRALDVHRRGRQLQRTGRATSAIVITKANASVAVTGYTVTYDGQRARRDRRRRQASTSEALTGLVLGDSFTDVPGGTAHWTFTNDATMRTSRVTSRSPSPRPTRR